MSFFKNWGDRSRARDFLKAFRKQRVYNHDLLPAARAEELRAYEAELEEAIKRRADLGPVLQRGETLAAAAFPARPHDAWRENLEVVFVAIVAALALRAYFLQPFKIPTGSMEPTLFGIEPHATEGEPPAFPVRVFEQLVFGRTYGYIRFDKPMTLIGAQSGQLTQWFEYTDLFFADDAGNRESRRLWINAGQLQAKFGLHRDQHFAANEVVVDFINDTGDQVLVNKMAYNFRLPRAGEVFVFKTTGIAGIEDELREHGVEGSQFYIKRCVGLPGQTLRVDPPYLVIDGERDRVNAAMKRVEAAQDGYRGYGILGGRQKYLLTPQETYKVDPDTFWAMGDNSYNSADSRFWGPVPRANVVGTAWIVYWPFGPRWGRID
jgi:signal peptidase I